MSDYEEVSPEELKELGLEDTTDGEEYEEVSKDELEALGIEEDFKDTTVEDITDSVVDTARGVSQGVSLGLADEIGAALSLVDLIKLNPAEKEAERMMAKADLKAGKEVKPLQIEDESVLDSYKRNLKAIRGEYKKSEERSPIVSTAGELAGAVIPGIGATKAISKIPKLSEAGKLSKMLAEGTGLGAAYGFGQSEKEDVSGIAKDTGLGAAGGLAGGAAFAGGAKTLKTVKDGMGKIVKNWDLLNQVVTATKEGWKKGTEGLSLDAESILLEAQDRFQNGVLKEFEAFFKKVAPDRAYKILDNAKKRIKLGDKIDEALQSATDDNPELANELFDLLGKKPKELAKFEQKLSKTVDRLQAENSKWMIDTVEKSPTTNRITAKLKQDIDLDALASDSLASKVNSKLDDFKQLGIKADVVKTWKDEFTGEMKTAIKVISDAGETLEVIKVPKMDPNKFTKILQSEPIKEVTDEVTFTQARNLRKVLGDMANNDQWVGLDKLKIKEISKLIKDARDENILKHADLLEKEGIPKDIVLKSSRLMKIFDEIGLSKISPGDDFQTGLDKLSKMTKFLMDESLSKKLKLNTIKKLVKDVDPKLLKELENPEIGKYTTLMKVLNDTDSTAMSSLLKRIGPAVSNVAGKTTKNVLDTPHKLVDVITRNKVDSRKFVDKLKSIGSDEMLNIAKNLEAAPSEAKRKVLLYGLLQQPAYRQLAREIFQIDEE